MIRRGGRCLAVIPLVCAALAAGCSGRGAAPAGDAVQAGALPELIQGLTLKDPVARARSAVSIGRIGPDAKEAVPALTAALKDRDVSVRAAAAYSLGRIGPEARRALPALEALKSQKPLRAVADAAIKRIAP